MQPPSRQISKVLATCRSPLGPFPITNPSSPKETTMVTSKIVYHICLFLNFMKMASHNKYCFVPGDCAEDFCMLLHGAVSHGCMVFDCMNIP